jgi:hypothetical protein
MFRVLVFLLCCSLPFSNGCLHRELTKWYAHAKWESTSQDFVQVSIFSKNTPAARSLSLISQLTAEGQAAFINALNAKAENLEQFSKALNEVGTSRGEGGPIDRTIFRKTVVFSVSKRLPDYPEAGVGIPQETVLRPADRISTLLVSLNMIDGADKGGVGNFESWDHFDTKYKTVNLGDISRSQKVGTEFSGSMGPAAQGRIPGKVEAKLTTDESLSEALHLSKRYIEVSGEIAPDKQRATLFLEGASDIDLAGTFSVDFDIRFKDTDTIKIMKVSSLRQGNRSASLDDIQISIHEIMYPKSTSPIKCNLTYEYIVRKVSRKDKKITEGYHQVKFLRNTNNKGPFTLVEANELSVPIYMIDSPFGRLTIEGEQIVIGFLIYQEAKDFLLWLKQATAFKKAAAIKKATPIKVGNYILKVGPKPLKEEYISQLVIDCKNANELK